MTEKAIKTITRGELARLWNVSPNTIDDLYAKGHLRRVAVNQYDLAHAVAYRMTVDPSRSMQARQINPRNVTPGSVAADAPGDVEDTEDGDDIVSDDAKAAERMLQARTDMMQAKAALSELQLRVASGEMLPIADVKRKAFAAGSVLRSQMDSFDRRVGPMLHMRTEAEVFAILDAELRAITAQFFDNTNAIVPGGVGLDIDAVWPAPKPPPEARRR